MHHKITGQTKPASNEFMEFGNEYYTRCKNEFGRLDTLTAKWAYEDLIPGLSDFDTRLVVADGTGPDDFVKLDEVVGRVHADLCREYPHWSRLLEHTPGIAVTWEELMDPRLYNPETRTWTPYFGDTAKYIEYEKHLSGIPWQASDEHFALGKFAYYFSPYQRGIDPAINLGIFEDEYAWHSRAMHYFTPAAQAALSVVEKRVVRGKTETLERWNSILPQETIFDEIMDMVDRQYNRPDLLDDSALADFESRLFLVLQQMKRMVLDSVEIVRLDPDAPIDDVKSALRQSPANPLMLIFNGVRFSRIRKGRYIFYLDPPDYFDSDWLLENEFVKWNREVLIKAVLGAYGRLKCGKPDASIEEIIDVMHPSLIDREQAQLLRKMYEMSFDRYKPGNERELIRETVAIWAGYYRVMEIILQDAKDSVP